MSHERCTRCNTIGIEVSFLFGKLMFLTNFYIYIILKFLLRDTFFVYSFSYFYFYLPFNCFSTLSAASRSASANCAARKRRDRCWFIFARGATPSIIFFLNYYHGNINQISSNKNNNKNKIVYRLPYIKLVEVVQYPQYDRDNQRSQSSYHLQFLEQAIIYTFLRYKIN